MAAEAQMEFQDYLVLFVDVLGQRQRLREMTGVPTNAEERTKFIEILRQTLNVVLTLRESFELFFASSSIETEWARSLPEQVRMRLRELRQSNVYYHFFSDSMIIAVPLKNENENCVPINGVYRGLLAACGMHLFSLAARHPLRGGLDVGVGTRLPTGEVYGSTLERAYFLESNLAEYPRILVGDTLLEYLRGVSEQTPQSDFGQLAVRTAQKCRRFFCQDNDGRLMLDFLGEAFREIPLGQPGRQAVSQAHQFVVDQRERYARQGDHELASRYFRLARYFDARIASWNISEHS